MAERSGGRPIELVDNPVVERGGFDQLQRQVVPVALRQALAAPDDHGVNQKIQLVEELQLKKGSPGGRGPLIAISRSPDSLSSRTESATSPSSKVELFQSTWLKVRDTTYFFTLFMKSAPGSSSLVRPGQACANPSYVTRPSSSASAFCIPPMTTFAMSSFQ